MTTETTIPRKHRPSAHAGFSLVEIVIAIAILGILASIAIMSIGGMGTYASATVAQRNLDLLNGAVNSFNNANWLMPVAVESGSGDEQTVFYSLQYRDALNPTPGSPYLPAHLPFAVTASPDRHRAVWNGTYFQMAEPGIDGTGIDLEAMTYSKGSGPPAGFRPPKPSTD